MLNEQSKEKIKRPRKKRIKKNVKIPRLNNDIIHIILSIYLPLKISLLEVKYNNCKLVCWDWYDIYKTIFASRSNRYYLIEKYDIDSFTPPTVYNYILKCDKNDKIFAIFNEGHTKKRMMLRTNFDGEFYLKGF